MVSPTTARRSTKEPLVSQLSSQAGIHGQEGNVRVAERCLAEPALLEEIAERLSDKNARLAADCAEVMTKVAEQRPELVVPYAAALLGMLGHKNGRARWEATHAFSLVAAHVPRLVAPELARLGEIARRDQSVIVRDYALDVIASYGATGPAAAEKALPFLREGLSAWSSKHAARVLRGLEGVVAAAPKLADQIRPLAEPFLEHARPGIRKAARGLLKRLDAKP